MGESLFQTFETPINKEERNDSLFSLPWFSILSQTHLGVSSLLHSQGKQAPQSQALHSHPI